MGVLWKVGDDYDGTVGEVVFILASVFGDSLEFVHEPFLYCSLRRSVLVSIPCVLFKGGSFPNALSTCQTSLPTTPNFQIQLPFLPSKSIHFSANFVSFQRDS